MLLTFDVSVNSQEALCSRVGVDLADVDVDLIGVGVSLVGAGFDLIGAGVELMGALNVGWGMGVGASGRLRNL